jgi:uncharacterized delta-60 repeat protein
MKRLTASLCVLAWLACAAPAGASVAAGELDPSFGGGGWVRTLEVRGSDNNYLPRGARAVAVQPDGKVVAVGELHDGQSNQYFGVFRYLPDGSLDPSFGAGGWTAVDIGSFEEARAVALQGDGKIVVAGETTCRTGGCVAAMRFNPDGSLDGSFGAGGVVRKEFYLEPSSANDIAIQPDGRIVLAGTRLRGDDAQDRAIVCVLRLLPDGRLDPGFSRDGVALVDHGYGNDSAEAVVLQRGRIVVAGEGRENAAGVRFGLARFRRDGRIDRSFGRRGHRLVGFGPRRLATAYALAAAPGGRLVVAGSATIEDRSPQVAIARLTADGGLDRGFGSGGRVRTSPGPFGGYALALAAPTSRTVLVAGRAFTDPTHDASDWALLRYSGTGRLDRSFGGDGIVQTDFGTGSDAAAALALVPGRAVVAGAIYTSLGIARYLTG